MHPTPTAPAAGAGNNRHGRHRAARRTGRIVGRAAIRASSSIAASRSRALESVRSETEALGQLVEQITLTLLFSLDYQRIIGSSSFRLISVRSQYSATRTFSSPNQSVQSSPLPASQEIAFAFG